MSKVTVLSSSEDLIESVCGQLSCSGLDFSANTVVFPGKRPAHILRKHLADRLQSGFIPPRIYTIDQFIEYLYSEMPGNNSVKLELADALSLLFDVHKTMNEKLGNEYYATLDAFIPVGIKLFAELEEMTMALLTVQRVREAVAAVPFAAFHPLSGYYKEFYALVEDQGFVSRAMMYRTVAKQGNEMDISMFPNLLLAGFIGFTKAEQTIFTNLQEQGNVHLIFQNGTGLREQLAKLKIPDPEIEPEKRLPSNIHCIAAPDVHGQVFALASVLNDRFERDKAVDHRMAIVLPSSDALFPLYHHVLSLVPGEEYNIALGYPVSRTPAFGFLSSLMQLVESGFEGTYSSKEYMKLLLHPYVKNIRLGTRSDITRVMMHTVEEYLAECGILQVALDALEQDEELLKRISNTTAQLDTSCTPEQLRGHLIEIHDNTIRKFTGFESVKQCAGRAKETLLFIFERSTAYLHPYFRPYVERLLEALEGISNSLLAEKQFADVTGYFSFLRHLLSADTVPFPGTPLNGIQVLGLLETRNLSFDTLYMLDANDDIVPGKPEADLLLPQQIRMQLGLETYREREKLVEYYFNLAVESAKEVYFFYSKSESGKNERSRFLEKLIWQFQQRDKTVSDSRYEQTAKYRVYLAHSRPVPIRKTDEAIRWMRQSLKISATALDTYKNCQLRFYYGNVLRLSQKDEASDDMDAAIVGKVVHDILAHYFTPCAGKQLTKAMLSIERLQEVVEECFTKQFGSTVSGTVLLFKRQTFDHLREFIEKYQLPLIERERVIISALERQVYIETRGYTFTGRIDRVELRNDKVYILDYKTGSDDKAIRIRADKLNPEDATTWAEAIQSFQLPMYMLLYNEMTKKGIANIIPSYLFLGKAKISDEIEVGVGDDEHTPESIYRAVEPVIFKMIDGIFNPAHDFLPPDDVEQQCAGCPYTAICGTQWTGTR